MKFSLVTYYTPDYQKVADLTLPNRQAYCDRHGYGHVVHVGTYHDPSLYYGIQLMHYLYDLLFVKSGNDSDQCVWVLTLPGLVMNMSRQLEEFIDPEHDFFIHEDVHGINAASFIIRKSEWSKRWLEMIIREAPVVNHCWHEQRVMQLRAPEAEWRDKVKIMPHPGINSIRYYLYNFPPTTAGDWKLGDFVLSFPGTSLEERIDLVTAHLRQVVQ